MKIRNELVLFLLATYAVLAPLSGIGWIDIGSSVAIAAGVLIGMFVMFGLGWIGGGDAKLAAVIALWLGADHALAYRSLYGAIRRNLYDRASSVSLNGIACTMSHRALDHAAACTRDRRSLRSRYCDCGAFYLPGDALDESSGLTEPRDVIPP